jgi:hypothetical protein
MQLHASTTHDRSALLCVARCLLLALCWQVIILPATAEPALIEAAKVAAAAAAGAANDGDSSGEPTVQLQRPSLFTYSKVCTLKLTVSDCTGQGIIMLLFVYSLFSGTS